MINNNKSQAGAIIGSSMKIQGDIISQEPIFVDGVVDGNITVEGAFTVGEHGNVHANVKAREVKILGSVQGNVEVTQKVAICEKGSLIGDIKTAGIFIDDGAYFKGSIDIVRPEPKVTTKVVQSEPRVEAHAG